MPLQSASHQSTGVWEALRETLSKLRPGRPRKPQHVPREEQGDSGFKDRKLKAAPSGTGTTRVGSSQPESRVEPGPGAARAPGGAGSKGGLRGKGALLSRKAPNTSGQSAREAPAMVREQRHRGHQDTDLSHAWPGVPGRNPSTNHPHRLPGDRHQRHAQSSVPGADEGAHVPRWGWPGAATQTATHHTWSGTYTSSTEGFDLMVV